MGMTHNLSALATPQRRNTWKEWEPHRCIHWQETMPSGDKKGEGEIENSLNLNLFSFFHIFSNKAVANKGGWIKYRITRGQHSNIFTKYNQHQI